LNQPGKRHKNGTKTRRGYLTIDLLGQPVPTDP
jgi:hypothetical protein